MFILHSLLLIFFSSSMYWGSATDCDCGTPWTFHLSLLFSLTGSPKTCLLELLVRTLRTFTFLYVLPLIFISASLVTCQMFHRYSVMKIYFYDNFIIPADDYSLLKYE